MTQDMTPHTTRPTRARTAVAVVTAVLLAFVGLLVPSATMADPSGPALTLSIAEVDLAGPAISDVAVTVTNTGSGAVSDVTVTIAGPINWTLYPPTHSIAEMAGGASVDVVTEIHVPSDPSTPTVRRFAASATYLNSAGVRESVNTVRLQNLEIGETGTLAEFRNNVGTTTLATVASGDYDGDGNSFSRELLAELGATPGASLEHLGATFTWPDVEPGQPDNVMAEGQSVELEGTGGQIAVLGSGLGNGASGQFVVHYTDGSVSTGTIGFGNWFSATPAYGETVAYTMKGRNTPAGLANTEYNYGIYVNAFSIDPRKTVSVVTLPNSPGLHIFDIAFGPYVPGPEPTQEPTEPTQEPTEPTQEPTEPTQEPTEPTQKPTSTPTTTPTSTGRPPLPPGTDLYTTPGYHNVNGREWFTECTPYSQTYRCTTEIWATKIVRSATGYQEVNAWVFNNMTYLPLLTRAQWAGNPLGETGEWTASDGREWRTECDTPLTGGNGCRSFAYSQVTQRAASSSGAVAYETVWAWVFNNMVRFK